MSGELVATIAGDVLAWLLFVGIAVIGYQLFINGALETFDATLGALDAKLSCAILGAA